MHASACRSEDRLTWVDGFLPTGQCASILDELRFAYWQPSTVMTEFPNRRVCVYLSARRVSESTDECWFTPELRRHIRAIDKRLEALIADFRRRREPWQATRYGRGGKFEYHFDSGASAREKLGDREQTVLIYLDTPRAGGSTHFAILDVEVSARAGRLLTWRNLIDNRTADVDMLHASLPLLRGRKTVLVTWVRQRLVDRGTL